jgi:carbonic anhydrase
MNETLRALLERNAEHVGSLAEGHFGEVQERQEPEVVSVCCSDSRVSQVGMWSVEEAGWLFTPSTVGNQVWDTYEGEKVVDGSVVYPIEYAGTRTAVVVGHTGCGAVTAALKDVRDTDEGDEKGERPAGVEKRIDALVPVVREGLGRTENGGGEGDTETVNRLVEHNVDTQVGFLLGNDDIPDHVDVYGFVYDLHAAYGDDRGRAYLVNANGETDTGVLRGVVPDGFGYAVERLL